MLLAFWRLLIILSFPLLSLSLGVPPRSRQKHLRKLPPEEANLIRKEGGREERGNEPQRRKEEGERGKGREAGRRVLGSAAAAASFASNLAPNFQREEGWEKREGPSLSRSTHTHTKLKPWRIRIGVAALARKEIKGKLQNRMRRRGER